MEAQVEKRRGRGRPALDISAEERIQRKRDARKKSKEKSSTKNVSISGEVFDLIHEAQLKISEEMGVGLTLSQTLTLIIKKHNAALSRSRSSFEKMIPWTKTSLTEHLQAMGWKLERGEVENKGEWNEHRKILAITPNGCEHNVGSVIKGERVDWNAVGDWALDVVSEYQIKGQAV